MMNKQQTKKEKQYYQTTISVHDKSILFVYWDTVDYYNTYHYQAERVIFLDKKEIMTIIHKMESDDSVIQFAEREK
jgi:hypothetical protein